MTTHRGVGKKYLLQWNIIFGKKFFSFYLLIQTLGVHSWQPELWFVTNFLKLSDKYGATRAICHIFCKYNHYEGKQAIWHQSIHLVIWECWCHERLTPPSGKSLYIVRFVQRKWCIENFIWLQIMEGFWEKWLCYNFAVTITSSTITSWSLFR